MFSLLFNAGRRAPPPPDATMLVVHCLASSVGVLPGQRLPVLGTPWAIAGAALAPDQGRFRAVLGVAALEHVQLGPSLSAALAPLPLHRSRLIPHSPAQV